MFLNNCGQGAPPPFFSPPPQNGSGGVQTPPPPAGRGLILLICVLYSSETQHVCIRWVSEDLHWIFDNLRGWVSVLKGCQRIPKTLILHPWVNPLAASLSTTKSWTRTFLFIFTGWTGWYLCSAQAHPLEVFPVRFHRQINTKINSKWRSPRSLASVDSRSIRQLTVLTSHISSYFAHTMDKINRTVTLTWTCQRQPIRHILSSTSQSVCVMHLGNDMDRLGRHVVPTKRIKY